MYTVNIHEAKTHLSRLVEQASDGEAFIIAKAGKPLVKFHCAESLLYPFFPKVDPNPFYQNAHNWQ